MQYAFTPHLTLVHHWYLSNLNVSSLSFSIPLSLSPSYKRLWVKNPVTPNDKPNKNGVTIRNHSQKLLSTIKKKKNSSFSPNRQPKKKKRSSLAHQNPLEKSGLPHWTLEMLVVVGRSPFVKASRASVALGCKKRPGGPVW